MVAQGALVAREPEQHPARIDHLVVAHDDPALLARLRAALPEDSAIVIGVPQTEWDFHAGSLRAELRHWLARVEVGSVALVAHSDAALPRGASPEREPRAIPGPIERVSRREKWLARTQNLAISTTHEIAAFATQLNREEPHVTAMMYRSDTRQFVAFQPQLGRFVEVEALR